MQAKQICLPCHSIAPSFIAAFYIFALLIEIFETRSLNKSLYIVYLQFSQRRVYANVYLPRAAMAVHVIFLVLQVMWFRPVAS